VNPTSPTPRDGPSVVAGARTDLLRALQRLVREPEASFGEGLASIACELTGARGARVFLWDTNAWQPAGEAGLPPGAPRPPRDLAETPIFEEEATWLPLLAEGELHGALALAGAPRDVDSREAFALLPAALGAILASKRLARQVKNAEFELRERVLELESLYDFGLALGANLDLEALAEEVLMRSIALTDAQKGSLVLFGEKGEPISSRSFGGDLLTAEVAASWRLPADQPIVNNRADAVPTEGVRLADCRKCLAVSIASGGRRLGVLAVADKETRGGIVDFGESDSRLLMLFANQAATALETARLHREALEKERLQRELELAAGIQRAILPRQLPSIPGFLLAAENRPTYEVGGDYYDFFPLSRGRFAFVVADVSGKGIPAALLVSTVHAGLHLQIDASTDVADLVTRLDRHLRTYSTTRKFLTLFFGLVDPSEEKLVYVSAGHSPALMMGSDGSSRQLLSTGLPVGLIPGAQWKIAELPIAAGDRLCVYSDGITEAVDAKDREFGIDRLRSVLSEYRAEPPAAVIHRILDAVAEHARGVPQYDDQTVLVLARE
jgi:phosphoserine phosphatase RsbU/P